MRIASVGTAFPAHRYPQAVITEALKELDTSTLATKADLNDAVKKIEIAMRDQAITIIKWMTGILVAQGALIVALIQYFK